MSGPLTLAGTLVVPARVSGRVPVVLIVAGSGPTDRNGNSGSVRSDMYAQLAWRLAERGVASLRYDKRGLGESSADPAALTFEDFSSDVVAGVRFLRADERFGAVAVAGHSEGAWLAIHAAGAGAPVSGIALLAGLGRGIGEVLEEQLAFQVDSSAAREFAGLFPRYLAGEELGAVPDPLQPLLLPVNRRFMVSLARFDPRAALARLRLPVLILQGDADIQVSMRDAQALKAAKPDARLVTLRGVNHLFKSAPSRDRIQQLAIYLDPSLPIVPLLPETLTTWIRGLR
jgi:pimeloyl-ACP methyl ester carboxylesterase